MFQTRQPPEKWERLQRDARHSPDYPTESGCPCATMVIVAFMRPLAQSGIAR